MRKNFPLAISLLLVVGCSTVSTVRTDDSPGKTFPKTQPGMVKVYSTLEVNRPYEIIGLIDAAKDAGDDSSGVIALLKEKACEMGADGVIDAKLTSKQGYWNSGLEISGVAVKFKQ